MTKLDDNTFSDMLTALSESFTKERQKDEPYKELFKAGSTHTGLLMDLTDKMTIHVLDACQVYKERHGIEINTSQYHFLLALPLLAEVAEKDAHKNEGMSCCVDKAYFILSEQLIALESKPTGE
jgi:hypothetical protein